MKKYFMYPFREGQIVWMKKVHPCGERRWKILNVGLEVGLQCLGCERQVQLSRAKLEQAIQAIEGDDRGDL